LWCPLGKSLFGYAVQCKMNARSKEGFRNLRWEKYQKISPPEVVVFAAFVTIYGQ